MMGGVQEKSGRVGVIGGGLGGLAAACTLGARGYDVVVLERNDWVGGKAAVLEADGFRFDMGPTILLMPSVIARIFAEAGRDYREYLDLIPLDPLKNATRGIREGRLRVAIARQNFRQVQAKIAIGACDKKLRAFE